MVERKERKQKQQKINVCQLDNMESINYWPQVTFEYKKLAFKKYIMLPKDG